MFSVLVGRLLRSGCAAEQLYLGGARRTTPCGRTFAAAASTGAAGSDTANCRSLNLEHCLARLLQSQR